MSYAQAAAKGPKQSPEEAVPNTNMPEGPASRAPRPPKMENSTSSSSYDKVEHINTEAAKTANRAADKSKIAADKAQGKSQSYGQTAEDKAKEALDYSKEKGSEFADSAEKNYEKAKKAADKDAKKAKQEWKSITQDVNENKDNPVYIGNAVLIAGVAAALGYSAYTKQKVGELDWQIGGIAAAAVGVLAVGDYFLSQYLLKNKYPKRK